MDPKAQLVLSGIGHRRPESFDPPNQNLSPSEQETFIGESLGLGGNRIPDPGNVASFARKPRYSLMRKSLALLAGGVLLTIIAELLGGLAIEHLGLFDVSASTAHPNVIRRLVHRTMVQSVERRATETTPKQMQAKMLLAGLCEYHRHCESCHGGPAMARSPWANGLYPTPPYLLDAHDRWTPSQLHWIVSNGIKMTAMPAWKASVTDRDIWNVVAFLDALPRLSTTGYRDTVASACRGADPR